MANADAVAPETALHVEVVYCPGPGINDCTALAVAPGTTLAQAVQASGVLQRHDLTLEGPQPLRAGVWGKARAADWLLREHDRVEIYRPLQVDPKEARRLRYKKQRSAPPAAPGPDAG